MAGHNKWSKVKRFKGALDVKRGKIFSRFSKEISVASRVGGGDVNLNPRLRAAILAARAQNMPNDTIERAIKKGTGEIAGGFLEELVYEGYGPGGVAIIVESATDNKNRIAQDLRTIFSKNHGNLVASGSVSYLFKRKGHITVAQNAVDEDKLLEIVLEGGADDLAADEDFYVITTPHDQLYQVGEAIKNAGLTVDSQKLTFIPDSTISVTDADLGSQLLRLCDALEDNDDVQSIHSNFDLSDELLARLSG
jgi:YebC/PmpR family DNA-binding regulatory protein